MYVGSTRNSHVRSWAEVGAWVTHVRELASLLVWEGVGLGGADVAVRGHHQLGAELLVNENVVAEIVQRYVCVAGIRRSSLGPGTGSFVYAARPIMTTNAKWPIRLDNRKARSVVRTLHPGSIVSGSLSTCDGAMMV